MSIRFRLVSQMKNKFISNSEQLFNATDLSPITLGSILPLNPRGKISTISLNNQETMDENQNLKLHTIKILLDINASTQITRKDILYERILKD